MEKELFYSLYKSADTKDTHIALSKVCRIHGADSAPLSGIFLPVADTACVISAFDVSKELKKLYPGYTLQNAGPPECVVTCTAKRQSKALVIIKALILCAVMFIGGAFTIITFHEDVGMRTVHRDIYLFFTGVKAENVPAVSIPYSIGIAAGFIMLFGLFNRKKKSPSVLDLDIYEQDKALKEYITTTGRKKPDG